MDSEKPKFDWQRMLITTGIVLFAALAVGGTTWYVMDKSAKEIKTANDSSVAALQKQVDELKAKLTSKSDASTATTTVVKDTIRPTVKPASDIKRFSDSWVFQFSEKMDPATIKVGNINLYIVGGSTGTLGSKALNNSILDGFNLNYDQVANALTIVLNNKDILSCASCTWEIQLTDSIKDTSGNSLTPFTLSDL